MSVLVSVIMPVYGNERFIEKAILSVAAEQGIDDLDFFCLRECNGNDNAIIYCNTEFSNVCL
ncbi:MAG: hypothetical protein Q7J24_07815 [Desulfomicrobium sp.]|nr:hypothetical protein [Desulfomicrobium sp.]